MYIQRDREKKISFYFHAWIEILILDQFKITFKVLFPSLYRISNFHRNIKTFLTRLLFTIIVSKPSNYANIMNNRKVLYHT